MLEFDFVFKVEMFVISMAKRKLDCMWIPLSYSLLSFGEDDASKMKALKPLMMVDLR